MISWAWGRMSIGNVRSNRSGSSTQPETIWGERRGGPGVHHVGVGREAAGLVPLLLA